MNLAADELKHLQRIKNILENKNYSSDDKKSKLVEVRNAYTLDCVGRVDKDTKTTDKSSLCHYSNLQFSRSCRDRAQNRCPVK